MNVWSNQQGGDAAASREVGLSYVLVADAHVERAAACLESIKPFNVGVLIARDGDEATRVLERFGPPLLLIIDLSFSRKDGFAVIEALRSVDRAQTEIIALSSFRELREFAEQRLAGLNVRVLGGAAGPAVVRSAIERALRNRTVAQTSAGSSAEPTAEDVHRLMAELAERAHQLCGTAGVAVYLRAFGETQFRASVTWTSEAPVLHSPYHIPRVFASILETGEALVLPDLTTQPLSNVPLSTLQDIVRGLVAVPIVSPDQQIVGTICVFDIKPLTLGAAEVDALMALGRGVSVGAAATSVGVPAGDELRPGRALHEGPVDRAVSAPSPGSPTVPAPDHGVSVGPSTAPDRAEGGGQPVPGPEPRDRRSNDAIEPPAESPSPDASVVLLLDRRSGNFAIARELARARREQRHLSVVLFDIGPLGRTNDSAPTESTEHLLGTVGETLMRAIRGSDLAIRWSGEELLLVLPGLSVSEARLVAERVRAAMQAGARHHVAVSGGVAELLAHEAFESVVARANEKLRLARVRGHNRVA